MNVEVWILGNRDTGHIHCMYVVNGECSQFKRNGISVVIAINSYVRWYFGQIAYVIQYFIC